MLHEACANTQAGPIRYLLQVDREAGREPDPVVEKTAQRHCNVNLASTMWNLAEAIAHAAWLYFGFLLSLRMVEDMLAARGIVVSHQAVRLWAEKFGIRNIKPNAGNRLILVLHG
jgi:hypothetical protein